MERKEHIYFLPHLTDKAPVGLVEMTEEVTGGHVVRASIGDSIIEKSVKAGPFADWRAERVFNKFLLRAVYRAECIYSYKGGNEVF